METKTKKRAAENIKTVVVNDGNMRERINKALSKCSKAIENNLLIYGALVFEVRYNLKGKVIEVTIKSPDEKIKC